MRTLLFAMLVLLAVVTLCAVHDAIGQPSGYYRYGRDCAKVQQKVWGMTHWSSVMLAQVEQESGWRPRVCSPYACGLTQFTPGTQAGVERQHNLRGSLWDPGVCLYSASLSDARSCTSDGTCVRRLLLRMGSHAPMLQWLPSLVLAGVD